LGTQVPKGLRETRVQPASRVPRGQLEQLARRAHKERRVTLVPQALPARPVLLAPLVRPDRPGKMVRLARWGLLERLVRRDQLDLRVSQGHRGAKQTDATIGAMGPAGPQGAQGPKGDAGPPGPARAGAVLRVISNQEKPMCDAGEFMISAYCPGEGGTLHINGTMGATCEGGTSKAVVVCAK
jgi:hypothetical protein